MDIPADYVALRQKVSDHDAALGELRAELRSSFSALNTKFDERFNAMAQATRTPLTTILSMVSVAILILSSLGFLALEPLKNRVDSIENVIVSNVVPRAELTEKWAGNKETIAYLQRQIDDLRQDYSALYSARDILVDMRDRLKNLELKTAEKK